MIEIVCPSCQARYQLPEGSIGPEGRKVSCSSCSHKWRASAEGTASAPEESVAEQPAAEQPAPAQSSPVLATSAPGGPGAEVDTKAASMAAVAASGVRSADQITQPPPATGDREEQMAAIRQMLADLKEGADAVQEVEPDPIPEPVTPEPVMRKRAEDEDDERDALKSRIDELDKSNRAAKGEAATSGYDPAKLRRMHEKRAKKLQRSRERKKKSGAFLTGFTLVALVTATMVGLYVMRPQIIAAAPQMGPALNEYVVTVDRYRVDMNEVTAEWKAWLVERIGGLTGKEKEEG